MGYEVSYERPVAVGNKVVVGLTVTNTADRSSSDISVQPFMSIIEHIMYISPINSFRPVNLALATDVSNDDMKYPIVIDSINISWNEGANPGIFTLTGSNNSGRATEEFENVSVGGEIGKFLIIGSK